MRLTFALPLVAAIALVGCDSADDGPKTMEEVAKETASMEKPLPGQYRSSRKVLEFEMPGLPADKAKQMKEMMMGAAPRTHEFCLTAEDVAKGFEERILKSAEGKCTFEKFDASTGSLDVKMSCETGKGMSSKVSMQGVMGATSSKMVVELDQIAPGTPQDGSHTKMEVSNERIGDCP